MTRWFGTNTDITAQRELEHALNAQNKSLQRSNEDLSRFAFFASHDMQVPLRSIGSFTQLALRDLAAQRTEKAAERLNTVVNAVRRMDRLIRDLLLYAQTSAETDPPAQTVSVDSVLDGAIAVLRERLDEAGATITRSGTLLCIRCNAPQLVQVLQNLISNSLKYSRSGVRPEVRVSASHQGS